MTDRLTPALLTMTDEQLTAALMGLRGYVRCAQCSDDRRAVCVGAYEDPEASASPSCDVCCGHGNEDGWCVSLKELTEAVRGRNERMGVVKERNDDLAALRQDRDRLQQELTTRAGLFEAAIQRAEQAEARWQALAHKIADYRAGTVPRGKSKTDAVEVATIQATLNVVEGEMAALDPTPTREET